MLYPMLLYLLIRITILTLSPQLCSHLYVYLEEGNTVGPPYLLLPTTHGQVLNNIVPVLKVVTVREAGNLGIFLRETLQMISYWRSSEQV